MRWWFILRHSCFRDCMCWDIASCGGLWFILEHSHFRWFILGHSHFVHIHVVRGFWFIWIMLRYFHFWQWELRLIDLLTYTRHDPSVVVDSDILRHSRDGEYFSLEHSCTIGSFTLGHIHLLEGDQLILDVGASNEWYGDHWIISCCPHCILGHSHLVRCFGIETWLSVCDYCFQWIMELLTPWVQSSQHTWMISNICLPFVSYSDISSLILSYFLSYQSLIIIFFYPTHLTVTHDLRLLSQLGEVWINPRSLWLCFHTSFGL